MSAEEHAEELRLERLAASLVENQRKFLEKLVAMRKKHDLSQAEVAERMGVSQPTVSAFENYDANPTLATIRRYAMAVDAVIVNEIIDDLIETVPEVLAAGSGPRMSWAPADPTPQYRFSSNTSHA